MLIVGPCCLSILYKGVCACQYKAPDLSLFSHACVCVREEESSDMKKDLMRYMGNETYEK